MRKFISVVIIILVCVQIVLDMVAYNQMEAEESSVYKYHLWLVILTLPLLLIDDIIHTKRLNNKSLRVYFYFILSVFSIVLLQEVLYSSSLLSTNRMFFIHVAYLFLFLVFIYNIGAGTVLKVSFLNTTAFILWIVFVIVFIMGWRDLNVALNMDARGMNNIYYVLMAFPFCQQNNNKKIRIITLVITGILCLFSLKRGAILAYLISTFFIAILSSGSTLNKKKIAAFLLSVSLLTTGYILIDKYSGGYITYRFQMEDSRDMGRNDIYGNVIKAQTGSSIGEYLFGHGPNSVRNTNEYGLTAHNDYMEILYDYGILPFLLWVLFIYTIVRFGYEKYKIGERRGAIILGSSCIFFVLSMVSQVFFMSYTCVLFFYWGLAFNRKDNFAQDTNRFRKNHN